MSHFDRQRPRWYLIHLLPYFWCPDGILCLFTSHIPHIFQAPFPALPEPIHVLRTLDSPMVTWSSCFLLDHFQRQGRSRTGWFQQWERCKEMRTFREGCHHPVAPLSSPSPSKLIPNFWRREYGTNEANLPTSARLSLVSDPSLPGPATIVWIRPAHRRHPPFHVASNVIRYSIRPSRRSTSCLVVSQAG